MVARATTFAPSSYEYEVEYDRDNHTHSRPKSNVGLSRSSPRLRIGVWFGFEGQSSASTVRRDTTFGRSMRSLVVFLLCTGSSRELNLSPATPEPR